MDADGKSRFVCFGSLCIQTVIVTAADMASDTQEGLGLLLIDLLRPRYRLPLCGR